MTPTSRFSATAPVLSPAVPLSPYGHTCSWPSVPVCRFFKLGHPQGRCHQGGLVGVHTGFTGLTLGPPSPNPNTSKSGTREPPGSKVIYGGLPTKPMWALVASSVPPAVPAHTLPEVHSPSGPAQIRTLLGTPGARQEPSGLGWPRCPHSGLARPLPGWAAPVPASSSSWPNCRTPFRRLMGGAGVGVGQGQGSRPSEPPCGVFPERPTSMGGWVAPSTWGSPARQRSI